MLRITIHHEAKATRFVVEGKLAAAWTSVLKSCWLEAIELPHAPPIFVELTGVSYVDHEGRRLLKKMISSGVKLEARDIQMKAIIEEVNGAV
jgi:hypothetical protein